MYATDPRTVDLFQELFVAVRIWAIVDTLPGSIVSQMSEDTYVSVYWKWTIDPGFASTKRGANERLLTGPDIFTTIGSDNRLGRTVVEFQLTDLEYVNTFSVAVNMASYSPFSEKMCVGSAQEQQY